MDIRTEIEGIYGAFKRNFGRIHDAAGADGVSGRDDIATFWQGIFDMDVGNATLETAEPEDYDDSAIGFGLNPDDFAPAICLWDARPSTA